MRIIGFAMGSPNLGEIQSLLLLLVGLFDTSLLMLLLDLLLLGLEVTLSCSGVLGMFCALAALSSQLPVSSYVHNHIYV